jgi:hypothetical protein
MIDRDLAVERAHLVRDAVGNRNFAMPVGNEENALAH